MELLHNISSRRHFLLAFSHQVVVVRNSSILVLTDHAVRSWIRLPDLQHRVLLMDASSLAFAAQIVVVAYAALVPDAGDGVGIAPVAYVLGVYDGGLDF